MKSFDVLIEEALVADVDGWGFGWLAGRAEEARTPWGYAQLLTQRLALVQSALDIDTGGGEVIGEASVLPPMMCATEAWPPNAQKARDRLSVRGVQVLEVASGERLPFPEGSFELVTSRHPVCPHWSEIHRVLKPGGHYFAQHVGGASAFELIERFLGPLPQQRALRDPMIEVAQAQAAGLTLRDLRIARCRMVFHDVGAVVWILRKCVWWVADFSVDKYRDVLLTLDEQIRQGTPFVAHSTRHLIELQR